MVPEMVDEAKVLSRILEKHAKDGTTLYMEEAILNCFMDMSGRIFMCVLYETPFTVPGD